VFVVQSNKLACYRCIC